jgi:REP element-mobilizing transposase RayT/Mor family transcriptional regulator
MPTRPRIDFAGYHHIVNRGVNRGDIFNNENDKDMFLLILNKASKIHNVIIHTYCLMDNHYHILIETSSENLSSYMRVINANYAKYFNKKYNRSGHLWQDRFKSKFIMHDDYLYSTLKYIEYNPVDANMANVVGEYKYTLFHNIIINNNYIYTARKSIMLQDFSINDLSEFLEIRLSDDDLLKIHEKQKTIVEKSAYKKEIENKRNLSFYFQNNITKQERNLAIKKAYNHGHSQVDISKYLKLSESSISKIVNC